VERERGEVVRVRFRVYGRAFEGSQVPASSMEDQHEAAKEVSGWCACRGLTYQSSIVASWWCSSVPTARQVRSLLCAHTRYGAPDFPARQDECITRQSQFSEARPAYLNGAAGSGTCSAARAPLTLQLERLLAKIPRVPPDHCPIPRRHKHSRAPLTRPARHTRDPHLSARQDSCRLKRGREGAQAVAVKGGEHSGDDEPRA